MASTRPVEQSIANEADIKSLLRRIVDILDERDGTQEEGIEADLAVLDEKPATFASEVDAGEERASNEVGPEEIVLRLRLHQARTTRQQVEPTHHQHHNLSPREQEIVRLVARGHPNKTIAAILEISPWTVSTHIRRIFAKLGVNSRSEMVASALTLGIALNQTQAKPTERDGHSHA